MLINVARLVTAYYAEHPDPSVVAERVEVPPTIPTGRHPAVEARSSQTLRAA